MLYLVLPWVSEVLSLTGLSRTLALASPAPAARSSVADSRHPRISLIRKRHGKNAWVQLAVVAAPSVGAPKLEVSGMSGMAGMRLAGGRVEGKGLFWKRPVWGACWQCLWAWRSLRDLLLSGSLPWPTVVPRRGSWRQHAALRSPPRIGRPPGRSRNPLLPLQCIHSPFAYSPSGVHRSYRNLPASTDGDSLSFWEWLWECAFVHCRVLKPSRKPVRAAPFGVSHRPICHC